MMELLCEELTQSVQTELIRDYIHTTAEIEREKPARDAGDTARQSAAYYAGGIIARSCMEIDLGQDEQGFRGLREAKKILKPHIEGIHADPQNTMVDAALDVTLNSFELPYTRSDYMTRLARQNFRVRTAESLNDYLLRLAIPDSEDDTRLTVGSIVELTAVGILSREPGILAMPALPHHDAGKVQRGQGNTNIDLTATWQPEAHSTRTRRIQAKAGCLSVGKHAISANQVPPASRDSKIERMRKALTYEKTGILLISGCCDLGLSFTSKNLQTAEYFIKETFGKATPAESHHLNNITNRLKRLLSSAGRIDANVIDQLIELRQADILARRYRQGASTFLCNLGLGSKSGAISLAEASEVPVADIYL